MTQVSPASASLVELLPADLCAACIGRVFAKSTPAVSNSARGREIRRGAPDPSPSCSLCEGIPARVDAYVRLCLEAATGYEFSTFLVGSVYHREVRRREDALFERLAVAAPEERRPPSDGAAVPAFAPAEYLKAEVNREVGKRLEEALEKRVDFQRPAITFQVDARFDVVALQVASLFVRGRYRKHERTMPQTRWPCRSCGGMGCRACEYKGKTYETSVEELVAAPFVEAAQATGESFHGMGREDIDARMLGTGRPFVLELKEPKRRALDYPALGAQVAALSGGRVEALEVALSDSGAPERYKAADPAKTYHARCMLEAPVATDMLTAAVAALDGAQLEQRTPERVSHRRADLVRKRRILGLRLVAHEGTSVEFEIRAESGTYIKEFVSGDDGRTRPSMANTLGVGIRVQELDVVAIDWTEPPSV